MMLQEPHTYIGHIAEGLVCQITVKPQDLLERGVSAIRFEWQGKPSTPVHLEQYIRFKREVFQDISNRSGKRIMDTSIMPNGMVVASLYTPQAGEPSMSSSVTDFHPQAGQPPTAARRNPSVPPAPAGT